jgi:pimeloyl-ACP methyl ester carboxylesterase
MSVLSPVETQVIVKKAYRAFFSPSKYEVKSNDIAILERGQTTRVPFDGGELSVTVWENESAPAVLLMHGWGGARAQMTGFVEPLLNAGYRVIAYDQPAQGDSDGKMTNILEITPTMDIMLERFGKFHAIIAHSFGTLITSYALAHRNFPAPSKLVYFGAFNRLLDALPRFQILAKLPDEVIAGILDTINENFDGDLLASIVNEHLVKQINVPALMFHDSTDNVTPVEDSRAIAKQWAGVKYVETNGLGHRGALQSKEVHEQVVEFIKA